MIGQKQRQGYSTQTLAHFRNLISKLLETARSWGWLQDNPARGVKLPPMQRVRRARVLRLGEIRNLADALRDPVRTMFVLGVTLGLRIGELLPLRLEDIDLVAALLFVRRDVYRGQLQPPKTEGSERRIPLPCSITEVLRRYLQQRSAQSEWLFPSASGTVMDDRNLIRREVEPVCDRLGIPRFSWHSLRHTFSTIAGNGGVPMPLLQSILGHSTLDTTMLYTHPLEDQKRQAVETVSRVLFPNVPIFEDDAPEGKTLIQ